MRRLSGSTIAVIVGALVAVGIVVFFLVDRGQPMCQAEADRVAAAMANPLGPMPSLSGLTARDASTVRSFRNAFTEAYGKLSGPDKVAKQQAVLKRWNTFIIPQMTISTRAEYGCR
ncbi:MAG TPA: hypothetical protein VMV22_08425 [Acidimicrobiales bacterium]|nr:hypothetical protein [Acidimicrobiales bacterium]